LPFGFQPLQWSVPLPKRNFGFEKRQKELKKRQKKEEKAQRKLDRANAPSDEQETTGEAAGLEPGDPET